MKPTAKTVLETFANPHPQREYLVEHEALEFTSLCPKTGQPDFGTLLIRYVPGPQCIELKSLKLYLHSFRNEGIFYEDVTNQVLADLVAVCTPRWMSVESRWGIRGGIRSVITAQQGTALAWIRQAGDPMTGTLDDPRNSVI